MAAGTNVGLVRQNNEDNFVVCPDLTTSDWRIPQTSKYEDLGEYGALLVVADGMGGANAGEVASSIAVETIQEAFSQDQLREVVKDDKAVQEFMKEVVKAADLRIFKKSKEDSSTRGMGTTVVMAWILGKRVYVCWCGDSRCYMLNKHKGLVRLSKDHSYVQELIDRGELDPDLAMSHPYSNVITRCLGDVENRAVPDTRIFQLHNGDTILLCSDGLSGLCTDLQILDLLIKFRDNTEECKNELISAALNEGGHDNVTVALCSIEIPGDKEDVEDDTLPKGTLPPVPLSETLKSSKSSNEPLPKKKNYWKGSLFFLIVVAIAFFTAKWLRTSPGSQDGEGDETPITAVTNALDSAEITEPIVSVKEDSVAQPGKKVLEEESGKGEPVKVTSETQKEEVTPTATTENKTTVKDLPPSDTTKAGLKEPETEVKKSETEMKEPEKEVKEPSDTTKKE